MDIARHQVVIGADTSEMDAKLAGLQGRFSGLGGILGGALAGTAALGITAVGAGLAYATTEAAGFEKTMSGVKAVSGASSEEMSRLGALAMQLGADTSFSAVEAGKGIEELIKAGISIGDVFGGAAAASLNLAAAGEISVSEAATIASNAMNQFGLKGSDMEHVTNLIAGAANASAIDVGQFGFSLAAAGAVANTVGFDFDDLATAIAVMGQSGIVGSDAGTSLKTMMMNLQPETKAQKKLFEELGITTKDGANAFFDASGKVKSMAEVADILKNATAGLTEQQRLSALSTMFGSDAIRAAAVLSKEGAAGFNEMATAMGKVTAASVAEERLNNVSGSLEKLQGSLSTAAITIGSKFMPGIKNILDGATQLVNDGTPMIDHFVDMVTGGADTLGAQFGIVSRIWKQAVSGDMTGAVNAAMTLVGDGTKTLVENFGRWAKAFIDWVLPMVDPFLKELGKFLAGVFAWMTSEGTLKSIGSTLGSWGVQFVSWLGPKLPDMLLKLGEFQVGIGAWIIKEGVPAMIRSASNFGIGMVDGIKQGLSDKWGELKDWINEHIGKQLPDWMRNLLGIHSPSTVFAEMGHNLIAGLIVGMQNKSGEMLEAAKGLFGSLGGIGGGSGLGMGLIRDIEALATGMGGRDFGRAAAAISASETGGGQWLEEIGGTGARGPFHFDPGGELQNFARFLHVSLADAGRVAVAQPMLAAQWALNGYLGNALRQGLAQGLSGSDLAMYGSRVGQRPFGDYWMRAGTWHRDLYGYMSGGVAMTPQIASLAENGRPEAVLPLDLLQGLSGGHTFNFYGPVYGISDLQDAVLDVLDDASRRGRINGAFLTAGSR